MVKKHFGSVVFGFIKKRKNRVSVLFFTFIHGFLLLEKYKFKILISFSLSHMIENFICMKIAGF